MRNKKIDKKYYTIKEVHEYLDEIDKARINSKRYSEISREPFFIFGFKCIYNFCLTQRGWIASHEECCEYCIHSIIGSNGSREERLQFNNKHNLPDRYNLPITNREVALIKKKKVISKKKSSRKTILSKRKSRRLKSNYSFYYNINAKDLKKALKDIKAANISILRRGKKNLWNDIYRYSSNPDDFIYVKGLRSVYFYPVLSENEDIYDHLIEEIDFQNKKFNLNIKKPTRDYLKGK